MNLALLEEQVKKLDNFLPIPLAKPALPRALIIDLNEGTATAVEVPQVYLNKYVGGPALAARLWAWQVSADPNPIVFTGDYAGNLISVAFQSPATNSLMFNTFPGKFDIDFCAVIVIGRLRSTSIVTYADDNLTVEENTSFTNLSALKLCEFYRGAVATGVAANNKIKYASAVCFGYCTGRGGLGYVMAEKNLKAISFGIQPVIKNSFDFTSFIRNANIVGWAPVYNISKRTDPRLFHLSSDEKKRKLGDVYIPCDATLMLGSNVGCFDIVSVYERYQYCLEKGLDPVSTGNILGWIMEAQERGLVALPTSVNFKSNSEVMILLDAIVSGKKGYGIFGDGLKAAAAFYGNDSYAKHINGLECGPYDYRGTAANAINDALGNWFPVFLDLVPGISISDKANLTIYNEELIMGMQCVNKNPELIIPQMIKKLGFLKRFLINKRIVSFDRFINTDDFNITDVFTAGQNCRTVVRVINSTLNDNTQYIPDYFCIDPESNAEDGTIIEIRLLLNSYKKALQISSQK